VAIAPSHHRRPRVRNVTIDARMPRACGLRLSNNLIVYQPFTVEIHDNAGFTHVP